MAKRIAIGMALAGMLAFAACSSGSSNPVSSLLGASASPSPTPAAALPMASDLAAQAQSGSLGADMMYSSMKSTCASVTDAAEKAVCEHYGYVIVAAPK